MTGGKVSLEEFLARQDEQLASLRDAAGCELEFSYASIDRVESALAPKLPAGPASKAVAALEEQLVHYLGEVLIDHAGGSWALADHPAGARPAVRVAGIAKRMFDPLGAVLDFRRLRRPGLMRDYTERWDLALRRAELARLKLVQTEELAALAVEVADLAKKQIPLDASEASLAVVEAALIAASSLPAERQRQLRTRVELLLGTAFMARTRESGWAVVEDPAAFEFGQFAFGGWSPNGAVLGASRGATSGSLHLRLQLEIEEYT